MARKTVERFPLRGAAALVTGAGSGIGRATAEAFAGAGCRVVCVDVDGASAADTAQRCGAGALALKADVADRAAMMALGEEVHEAVGPLAVLVNNAGVGMSGRFLDTTDEDWDWILGINVRGVIHGCQVFGPAMLAAGRGHVVNLASALGYTPRATEPAYVTTKAAVLALSQCLRADWGPRGVGVSAICPGVIATPIITRTRFRGERGDPAASAKVESFFAKRGHSPDKVAAAIIDAVRRDRPIVPVGAEAWIGYAAHRLLPARGVDVVARQQLEGV